MTPDRTIERDLQPAGPAVSAVICTHNPRPDHIEATLRSLRAQRALHRGFWELLIIDNASADPLGDRIDLSWHADARIVREERLGLSHARLRSFKESRGDIIVYIDDDNVLDPHYLERCLRTFDNDPRLGAIGGKSLPRWEVEPPTWFFELGLSLACRDLGDTHLEAFWRSGEDRRYPDCAPIGAGMAVRRSAYEHYVRHAAADPARVALGRKGSDLASGEDNDIVLTMLSEGWKVAYAPELTLHHLIPRQRLLPAYLERYARSSNRTWVQVLAVHGIRPWRAIAPWTVPARKLRAWVRLRAWAGHVGRIRWHAACGTLEGQASLSRLGRMAR